MLLVGLFVYASALANLKAVELEDNILVPLSAGFLFGARDWRRKNANPTPPLRPSRYKPFIYYSDLKILYRRVGNGECRVCYGDQDCFVMNLARCDYYVYTAEIMDPDESGQTLDTAPELKFEVDSMIYNLVDRASGDPRYTECIPFLSRYTDCTKDNICLGCKTCECDVDGRWNCTLLARCRPESDLHEIDHPMLLSVIENLKKNTEQDNMTRRKRSYPNAQETLTVPSVIVFDPEQETTTESSNWDTNMLLLNMDYKKGEDKIGNTNFTEKPKVSFDDITEWLQEIHRDIKENKSQNTAVTPIKTNDIFGNAQDRHVTAKDTRLEKDQNKLYLSKLDFDYLVLNNISVGSKNSSRRKPMQYMSRVNHEVDYMRDYEDNAVTTKMSNHDENTIYSTVTQSSFSKLDIEAVTEALEKSITKMVIDLLESAKTNDNLTYLNDGNFALLDYMDISDKFNTTFPITRPDNDEISELNSINIMKRDVGNAMKTTKSSNVTTTKTIVTSTTVVPSGKKAITSTTTAITESNKTNITKHIYTFNKSVISPLTDILKKKEKEIEELTRIKKYLIDFLDDFKDGKVFLSSSYKKESFLNNYKQHVITKIKGDVRTSNISQRQQLQLKLKRDVYEVIKDIVGIQKLSDPKKLPDDLKFLIRAMKHYVHKQGFHINNKVKKDNFRRRWNTIRSISYDPIKENLVNILEEIDRNMPLSTGLYPFSRTAKKILKRIIKQHYIDEFAMIGLRVYDPNYNLTNDLQNIGTKWKQMMDSISVSPPSDELYNMKLLHLELSVDVSKMNDALSLINFAHRRQMVPVDEVMGKEIISQISDSLEKINNKVLKIVHFGSQTIRMKTRHLSSITTTTKPDVFSSANKPKMSFLQQIKSLLRNSKNDILELIKKKVPKTDVLKELARKQLDINKNKMSEYERKMSSWQHNFGIIPNNVRMRRGSNYADRKDRNRIKNIIPRYLRGKLRPAINQKHSKNSKSRKANNNFSQKAIFTSTTTFRPVAKTTKTGAAKTTTAVTLSTTSWKPIPTSEKP